MSSNAKAPPSPAENLLPVDFKPGPNDVICARGKHARNHEGNKKYRQLIQMHSKQYSEVDTKYQKSLIVSQVVDKIRGDSPLGGFVKQKDDGRWYQADDVLVREKVGQAFRDNLHRLYRLSTKCKRRRRENVSAGVVHDIAGIVQSNRAVSACMGKLSAEVTDKRGRRAPDGFFSQVFSQANINMLEAFKKDGDLSARFREAEKNQKKCNKD